jgi:hypothetical protein
MLKKMTRVLMFSIFLFFSLALKINNTKSSLDGTSKENLKSPIERLSNNGFSKIDEYMPLNNDFVVTTSAKYEGCDRGSVFFTPLFKNSEAVSVLKQKILKENDRIYFVYRGKIYDDFPSFVFWMSTNLEKITEIFNQSNGLRASHYIVAVIERGSCDLKETVNWKEI